MSQILLKVPYGYKDSGAGFKLTKAQFKVVVNGVQVVQIIFGSVFIQPHQTKQNSLGKNSVEFQKLSDSFIKYQFSGEISDTGNQHHVEYSHFVNAVQKSGERPENKDVEEQGITPYRKFFLIYPAAVEDFIYAKLHFHAVGMIVILHGIDAGAVFKIESGEIVPVCFKHVRFFGGGHESRADSQRNNGSDNRKYYSFRYQIIRSQRGMPHQYGKKHDGCRGNAGDEEVIQ